MCWGGGGVWAVFAMHLWVAGIGGLPLVRGRAPEQLVSPTVPWYPNKDLLVLSPARPKREQKSEAHGTYQSLSHDMGIAMPINNAQLTIHSPRDVGQGSDDANSAGKDAWEGTGSLLTGLARRTC